MYRPRFSLKVLLAASAAAALFALTLRFPQPWLPPLLVAAHVLLTLVAAVGAIAATGSRRVFFAAWALTACVWTWTFYDAQGIVPVGWKISGNRTVLAIGLKGGNGLMWLITQRITEVLPKPNLRVGVQVLAPVTPGVVVFEELGNAKPRVIGAAEARAADVGAQAGMRGGGAGAFGGGAVVTFGGGASGWMATRIVGEQDGKFQLVNSPHLYDAAALRPVHDMDSIERTLQSALGIPAAWLGAVLLWAIYGPTADANLAAKGGKE